jgi:hypothetical protein
VVCATAELRPSAVIVNRSVIGRHKVTPSTPFRVIATAARKSAHRSVGLKSYAGLVKSEVATVWSVEVFNGGTFFAEEESGLCHPIAGWRH